MLNSSHSTLMIDGHTDSEWLEFFLSQGLEKKRTKILFEKDLRLPLDNVSIDFTAKSLIEMGRTKFLEYMIQGSLNDPETSHDSDHQADFQAMVDDFGDSFDPEKWVVIFHENQAVGVVLPQVYQDKPYQGTLAYICILPQARGKGYGKKIHLYGLNQLKNQGVIRYIGSTSEMNLHMINIFKSNGCHLLAERYFIG